MLIFQTMNLSDYILFSIVISLENAVVYGASRLGAKHERCNGLD